MDTKKKDREKESKAPALSQKQAIDAPQPLTSSFAIVDAHYAASIHPARRG